MKGNKKTKLKTADKQKKITKEKSKKLHDIFPNKNEEYYCADYYDEDYRQGDIKTVIFTNLLILFLIVIFSPIVIAVLIFMLLYFVIRDFINSFVSDDYKEINHGLK